MLFRSYNSYLLGNNPRDSAFRRLGIKALDAMVALDDLLLLTQADNNGRISTVGSLNDGIVPWFNKRIEDMIFKGPVVPKPLITGDDLIHDFSMKQGIELGKLRKEAYDYQIENDIQDKEVMVEYVKGLLKEKGDAYVMVNNTNSFVCCFCELFGLEKITLL